jgi:molybdenum cofactor cytidylyltransferase
MPAERAGAVAAIVLAAGSSERMGQNKLLLPLGGEPLVRRTVRRAIEAHLEPVIVVVGFEAARMRAALEELPCRIVLNDQYALGVNRSLRTGLQHLPASAAAAIVILADMPHVTSSMLEQMVARFRAGAAPLVISDYAGVNAPPMLYDRALFLELGAMEGEGCGRQVVRRHRAEADVISWPADALADVDVPADYERMRDAFGDLT